MARNNNNKLKAFVRFDGSGRIVPSRVIVQAFKPKVGNYKEIDAKECCNYVAPTTSTTTTTQSGTVVQISHDQMFDPVCTTQTTLAVQVGQGTSFSDAVTITGDFASLGAYYTPADPNNPMSQAPRFKIAYLVQGVLKNREFTLIAVGVASGIGGMGPTQEQTCQSTTTTTSTTVAPTYTWFLKSGPTQFSVCSGSVNLTLYTSPSAPALNIGVQLYTDNALTIPYSPASSILLGVGSGIGSEVWDVNTSGQIVSLSGTC